MSQQVLHGHLPLHRHQLELAVVLDADLLLGELRNEFGDGIAQDEVAVLDQHHDADGNDRLGHREDAEEAVMRHRRGRRGLCRPIASNHPIWPRRATITVAPGRVPLSTSRLKASDIRCRRALESPMVSGLASGREGVWGRMSAGRRSARSWSLPLRLLFVETQVHSAEGVLWIGRSLLRPCNRGMPYA